MKKSIFVLACSLACLVSCTGNIDVEVPDMADKIVMNSLMTEDENTHYIRLSLSTVKDGVKPLNGADVRVTVNGRPVVVQEDSKNILSEARYWFYADFTAGDEIDVSAEKNGIKVSSSVTVPQKAEILSVTCDTLTVSGKQKLRFNVGIRDRKGERNFYRLRIDADYKAVINGSERERASDVELDIGKDPILNDGYSFESESDDMVFSTYDYCLVFSDRAFADKDVLVSVTTDYEFNSYMNLAVSSYELPVTVSRNAIVKLQNFNQDAYNYFKAINLAENVGYDASVIFEPISFPENVKGGYGFVTAASVTKFELKSPDLYVEPEIYTGNNTMAKKR